MIRFTELDSHKSVCTVKVAPSLIERGYVTVPERVCLDDLRDEVRQCQRRHGKVSDAQNKLSDAVHDRLRMEVAGG